MALSKPIKNDSDIATEEDSPSSSKSESDEPEFFEHVGGGKFRIGKVLGDGNCLFRCMSRFIFGTQEEHEFIRGSVVRYIASHWREFQNFEVDEDVNSYAIKMSRLGAYGTQVELIGFVKNFKTELIVYFRDSPQQDPLLFGWEGTACFLLYSGPSDYGHYDVLVPIDTIWCDEKEYDQQLISLRRRCKRDFKLDVQDFKEEQITAWLSSNTNKPSKTEEIMLNSCID